jgi:hypothetical protein
MVAFGMPMLAKKTMKSTRQANRPGPRPHPDGTEVHWQFRAEPGSFRHPVDGAAAQGVGHALIAASNKKPALPDRHAGFELGKNGLLCYWCLGPESNRHALRRRILSPLRLPIPPPRQVCTCKSHIIVHSKQNCNGLNAIIAA